jgi:formate dehydrogenase gamma subunit
MTTPTNPSQTWRAPLTLVVLGLLVFAMAGASCGELDAARVPAPPQAPARAVGVCPPFPLRDEAGNVIDTVRGVNDTVPYSPRQTCGASGCHDYAKIIEGFHFTQGKGEKIPAAMAERYAWVTSPGNYGGNWCSPAPLYRQLAPKKNTSARTIDMTSFDFVTATCGNCHPGGGPLEFDRDGKRYDSWMRDPASGLVAGGENGLDGDYYKARWSETGVIEGDCLLCHLPEYDLKKRNGELANLNFRWAATAGAGFGTVAGKVSASEQPTVTYDKSKFDADGNVLVHIAPEPRNETCLNCHFKPDWKKRGAAYSARTDVHMVAGLRCVDCHAAGSRAADPRIRGREVHQFGKGDDPSGWVRNDLDNTVRSCESCHLEGWRNAPRATHAWLPPLHMEKIACQTCHIPTRAVKSTLVQASDVYNPAPRITPPPKHIWTFYDQEMAFWNHYGELELFTGKDEPTNVTRPTLIRYKGKIYPANRVHSAWVGFEEQGKPGLNQLFMKDFFQMWTQHRADPKNKYAELAKITDDNKDGVIEVNRAEEINALLAATNAHLAATGFPLANRRLVWVSDSKAYYSSTEVRDLPREEHEATAYASVYKFSHDVSPARAALGAGGCTDCHRSGSSFYLGGVLAAAFSGEDARPRWIPNHEILGLSRIGVALGVWREGALKPAGPWVLLAVGVSCLFHFVVFGARRVRADPADKEVVRYRLGERLGHAVGLASFLFLALTGCSFLLGKASPLGETARRLHGYVGWAFAVGTVAIFIVWVRSAWLVAYDWPWLRYLGGYFGFKGILPAGKFNAGQKIYFWFAVLCGLGLAATGMMMFFFRELHPWMPFAYTLHDGLAILLVSGVLAHFYLAVIAVPGALRAIFEGKVSATWAQHHHPDWTGEAPQDPTGRSCQHEEH